MGRASPRTWITMSREFSGLHRGVEIKLPWVTYGLTVTRSPMMLSGCSTYGARLELACQPVVSGASSLVPGIYMDTHRVPGVIHVQAVMVAVDRFNSRRHTEVSSFSRNLTLSVLSICFAVCVLY